MTKNSVVLQWEAHNDALVLIIRLREAGTDSWKYYTRGNGMGNKNALQVGCIICESIHKLKPNTKYEWQIRAFCNPSRSIYSDFIELHTFTTLPINLNLGNDRTICKGETIGIRTSVKADSYVWSNGAETSYISVSPNVTTTYTISATIDGGVNTQSVVVYVVDAPEVSAGADQTICAGKIVSIKAIGADNYEWNTGSLRDEVTFIPTTTTTYTVTGINSYNCTAKASVVVYVNSTPFGNAGADIHLCKGETATLNARGYCIFLEHWRDWRSSNNKTYYYNLLFCNDK